MPLLWYLPLILLGALFDVTPRLKPVRVKTTRRVAGNGFTEG